MNSAAGNIGISLMAGSVVSGVWVIQTRVIGMAPVEALPLTALLAGIGFIALGPPPTPEEGDPAALAATNGAGEAHALRIGSYRRFEEPVPRSELVASGAEPSQNFRYIGNVAADEQRVEPATVVPADE